MHTEIIYLLLAVSGALSLGSIIHLVKNIYLDYSRKQVAKKRYSADPNDPNALEISDFYSPNVTYGNAILTLVFFGIPIVNLATFTVLFLQWLYRVFNRYKNVGIIEW